MKSVVRMCVGFGKTEDVSTGVFFKFNNDFPICEYLRKR